MINEDNVYFVNTPIEIQNSEYNKIIQKLNILNISNEKIIYVKFAPVANLEGKYYFEIYIKNSITHNEMLINDPEYIIFLQ